MNKWEARRLEVWHGRLQEEMGEWQRGVEGLARGWDKLNRQRINLGARYLETLEHDPVSLLSLCRQELVADPSLLQTGLTIYTGPQDAKAGKTHDESWFSIVLLYIDHHDVADIINLILRLALLLIIPRLARRNKPSEHSPESDITPETAVKPITRTSLVVVPSSTLIFSSSFVVIASSPTAVIKAVSPAAMKLMAYTMSSSLWLWIFTNVRSHRQQELASATQDLDVARPASYEGLGASIVEYKEDTDVNLPVMSSKQVSAPRCPIRWTSNTVSPPQLQGMSAVVSVRLCMQKEQTPVNVAPEFKKVLGNLQLGFRATVSM